MNITESEILEAITVAIGASPQSAEGLTAPELAEQLGIGQVTVRKYIRALIQAGKWEPCRVKRDCLDGRTRHTPAYRVKA